MNDLHVVIVSWNVEKLLERCLRSLPAACEGLAWDVAVVDNASHDGSVEVARRFAEQFGGLASRTHGNVPIGHFPWVQTIANPDNRGFAKACNQGMAGYDSRYVLLLNPDTECPASSLAKLVRAADAHPEAGIAGPQLTDAFGRHHPSTRRFPTVWSHVGILLKLHHLLPFLPAFRRYYMAELETEREQYVDQIEGSCFLIRRECIEDIGGFDERYFIWYEEVDYCKTAAARGWKTLYTPSAMVMHRGTQSFGQVFSYVKQRLFNASMIAYFDKWHRGWKSRLIRIASWPNLASAWVLEVRRLPDRHWIFWVAGIIALEIVSAATVFLPVQRAAATVIAGCIMLVVAFRRPSIGLAMLLLELAIGSKGALLKIPDGWNVNGGISLRIVLFTTFLVGWFINAFAYWRGHRHAFRDAIRREVRGRGAWFALAVLIVWGIVRGVWLGNPSLFGDANAWGFLVLLVPVIDVSVRDGERLVRQAGHALIAALIWLPIKTMGLLYIWSHGIKSLSQPLYLWVRRTGVAEVTLVTGNLFRVFMQSQVYAIAGFLTGIAALVENEKRKTLIWFILVCSGISVLISLSRSFWVGLCVGAMCLLFWTARERKTHGKFPIEHFPWVAFRTLWTMAVAVTIGIGVIAAIVAFPYPRVDVGSLKDLFSSRGSVTDAAAESRWNLLPVLADKIGQAPILGSGFGATVTYQSRDPRILAQDPDGWYTTYAFEWGLLEHWIKFGILGIPVMLWLLLSVMTRVWKAEGEWWIRAGFVSSLVALGALHVFTPYLNHPLGFGFLLAAEGWITANRRR